MKGEHILEPAQLRRYADAIAKASLGVGKGDTLLVTAEPAHRELAVAVVDAGYRAGARVADLWYADPLAIRARLLHGSDESLPCRRRARIARGSAYQRSATRAPARYPASTTATASSRCAGSAVTSSVSPFPTPSDAFAIASA